MEGIIQRKNGRRTTDGGRQTIDSYGEAGMAREFAGALARAGRRHPNKKEAAPADRLLLYA
jgi:hypothetical protein